MAESHDDRKICFAAQSRDEVQSSFGNLKNKTLDVADNLIFNQLRGIRPKMVFRYIATGLIGMQLSAAVFSGVSNRRSAITIASKVNGVLALLFFIGLTISLLVRRYSSERTLPRKT